MLLDFILPSKVLKANSMLDNYMTKNLKVGLFCAALIIPIIVWQFCSQPWFPRIPEPWSTLLAGITFTATVLLFLYTFTHPENYLYLAKTNENLPDFLIKPDAYAKYGGIFGGLALGSFFTWYFQWGGKGITPYILFFSQMSIVMLLMIFAASMHLKNKHGK